MKLNGYISSPKIISHFPHVITKQQHQHKSRVADIYSLCLQNPFRGSGTQHFRWKPLWFFLYQTCAHHSQMSWWKPFRGVRWCRRLQLRESPDETSHKGDTHTHTSLESWLWLIHHGGVPQTCRVTTLQLSHLHKLVNWVDFSISLHVSCV